MTRLTTEFVRSIPDDLRLYDQGLLEKTGHSLRQIACRASRIEESEMGMLLGSTLVGIVPVTSGEGKIEGFCQAVQGITNHLGAPSFVTRHPDVAGLAEAVERRAEVIFLADDGRFIALNMVSRTAVDNSEATARGYLAALDFLAKGLRGRPVLVIGAGRVGGEALSVLQEYGARPGVYDPDDRKTRPLESGSMIIIERDLEKALEKYSLLLEASPASAIIQERHIKPDTMIAACGIPLGLSPAAAVLVRERLIHDPLQIGVAAMLTMALTRRRNKVWGVDRKDPIDPKSM